jgi:hypothetical protein
MTSTIITMGPLGPPTTSLATLHIPLRIGAEGIDTRYICILFYFILTQQLQTINVLRTLYMIEHLIHLIYVSSFHIYMAMQLTNFVSYIFIRLKKKKCFAVLNVCQVFVDLFHFFTDIFPRVLFSLPQ